MSTPGELLEALGRQARGRRGQSDGTRTYRGRSVEELIPQIERELGPEAIVVRRREGLTGGVMGFFQHAFVEIEAMPGPPGVDIYDDEEGGVAAGFEASDAASPMPATAPALTGPPPATSPPPALAPAAPTFAQPQYTPGASVPPPVQPPAPPVSPDAGTYAPPAPTPTAPPEPFFSRTPPPPTEPGSAYVTARLAALARAQRTREVRGERLAPEPLAPAEWSEDFQELVGREMPELAREPMQPPEPSQPERRTVAPGSQSRARAGVAKGLQRYGIGEELANELLDGAAAHALALAPRSGLAHAVRTTLVQRIPVAPALSAKGAAIAVVGAGGAGKTTCCAALLGAYRKGSSLPASCATIVREGERGELRMILSPTVMKPTPAGSTRAQRAMRRARSDGMAVLDTPSVSPSDRTAIRELARLLAELKPDRVVVALPATLGGAAAAQLLGALAPLGADALAITHADETDQLGVAVEAACRFDLAPEYMLDRGRGGGWRLRQVDPTGLAEKLLP